MYNSCLNVLARLPQLICPIVRIIRWRVELSYYQNANQDACLFFLCRVIERTKEYKQDTQMKNVDV